MKIHALSVNPHTALPFDDVLTHLSGLNFTQRETNDIRLDAITRRDGKWLLDFAKGRHHGPGKFSPTELASGIDLEDEENFCEETAALFCPDTGHLLVQYNHYGARQGAIKDYFNDIARGMLGNDADVEDPYTFSIVLNRNTYAALRNQQIFRSLEIDISVPGATREDRLNGVPLGQVLRAPLPDGSDRLTLKVSASTSDRKASLARDYILQSVETLLGSQDVASKIVVKAKETDEAKVEALDLLEAKLERTASIPVGRDRRYPQAERWGALRETLDIWNRSGALLNNG